MKATQTHSEVPNEALEMAAFVTCPFTERILYYWDLSPRPLSGVERSSVSRRLEMP